MEPQVDQIEGFRLSPQQERLWRLASAAGRQETFPAVCEVVLEGEVTAAGMEASAQRLVMRHEILRTRFRSTAGISMPLQVIAEESGASFEAFDLRSLDPEAQRRRLDELFVGLEGRVDPGSEAPPLAVVLATVGDRRHHLLAGLPALCADAVSLKNLVVELVDELTGGGAGEEPIQYADAAEAFNSFLESDEAESGRSFWRGIELVDAAAGELPGGSGADGTDPAGALGRCTRELGAPLWQRLCDLAEPRGITPENLPLAAWAWLLGQLTQRPAMTLGLCLPCREFEGLDSALGAYAKSLPVTLSVQRAMSFLDLVGGVAVAEADAAKWQDSFDWALLAADAGAGGGPPSLSFGFESGPWDGRIDRKGLTISPLRQSARCDRFELKLTAWAQGRLQLEYAAPGLRETAARLLLARLESILRAAAERPDRPLAELDWLPAAERHQVLFEANDTGLDLGAEVRLHRLVAARARQVEERIALAFEDEQLSYGELERRVQALAGRLERSGVGPERLVAVALDRSLELVVALLAVLEAGGAYLPLDPDYPHDRLAFFLEDAAPRVVLTRPNLDGPWRTGSIPVLELDRGVEPGADAAVPATAVAGAERPHPDALAYVLYTSGSTGRPKGVAVSHRSIHNRLAWMQHRYPIGEGDRLLFKTPIGFDASIWEIFVPLMAGARLEVARPDAHRDSGDLVRETARRRITVLQLVPSMWAVLAQEAELDRCTSLRRLYSGGEALPVPLRESLTARLAAEFHNLYGPTEAAIDVCHWPAGGDGSVVPIGRPLANLRVFVLDPGLRPVPFGMPGELCVSGVNLARGYLGRTAETAVRFRPDPSTTTGGRLYRTGDAARRRPDGVLEFLGRADDQIKIRGVRVELGEIEAALGRHPGVAQAAASLRQGAGGAELVAFVVPVDGAGASEREILETATAWLPPATLPASLDFVKSLPRLPNGKLDRRALADLEIAPPPATAQGGAARSITEEVLIGLWREILGVDEIGVDDDFLALGGHSLSATQLAARVRGSFGVNLSLRAFFQAPTVARLGRWIEAAMRKERGLEAPPLVAVDRQGPLPVSFAQRRLWLLDRLDPGNPAYNLVLAHHLSGRLDRAALAGALREVVRRHESLRTTFRMAEVEPVQVVHPHPQLPLPLVDLRALSAAERRSVSERLARRFGGVSFDLEAGPLVRSVLLRLEESEHVTVILVHHIVGDGWSTQVLTRELAATYQAFAAGRPAPLEPMALQYADFAAWQRSWLSGETLDRQLAYWRRQLEGVGVLQLPTDRPRPSARSFRGATVPIIVGEAKAGDLRALGRRGGATLFMALTAAFSVLLSRYTGELDVAMGSPVANRTHSELEGMIGFFVNTLVLRLSLRGEPSFLELLERARTVTLEAVVHQDLPFERLVEALGVDRDLGQNPLFQVMLAVQKPSRSTVESRDLTLTTLPISNDTTKFDLTLDLIDLERGLEGLIAYSTDLFDATTVARMAGHWRVLIDSVLAAPDQPVGDLPILTPAEREQLATWNDTGREYPEVAPLSELIGTAAAHRRDAIAVAHGDRQLSYGELLRRADALAGFLAVRGLGAESIVPVFCQRSLEMVVALVGVLRAGAAYLPMDVDTPPKRLAWMLEDCAACLVLTQEELVERLPPSDPGAGPETLLLDTGWGQVEAAGAAAGGAGAAGPVSLDQLAYTIFTSGSTGLPKGAMVSHRGIVNRLLWMQEAYRLGPADRVLQKTPYSFDVSVWEFFWPLLAGARLEVADPGAHQQASRVIGLIVERGISVLHFVPSMLQVFLAEPAVLVCDSLRQVIASGEALSSDLVAEFEATFFDARLDNLYGPTEASVDVSYWPCRDVEPGSPIPIGRPISNLRLHITDPRLRPLPAGVPGELLIAGTGLGRGYLNRPSLTAQRFVPDPLPAAGRSGERAYRTGDRVRFLPAGEIEFLGRLDHQVKLRGLRIELGEIEAVVESHPAVRQAVVLLREDREGEPRLTAYLVTGDGAPVTAEALREHTAQSVPGYMLPVAWVVLRELPLSPNGKVDRRRLPAPGEEGQELRDARVAPRTDSEKILAGIWCDLLGADEVGIHDDFFKLGGHSILAAQVVARVKDASGVDLQFRDLFETPTIAALAALIERGRETAVAEAPPPLRRRTPDERPVLSFGQQRLWFLDQLEPDSAAYNIPTVATLRGTLDAGALARALREVVRRHEVLRTTFGMESGEPVQQISSALPGALPVVDLHRFSFPEAMQARAALTRREAARPFDLGRGPLLRAFLVEAPQERHYLVLTMHHIVSDGWSIGIFLKELMALYDAFSRDQPSPLTELPIQYADYAVWQRSWLSGEVLERELRHWREQLSGAPPILELPSDRPRPGVQTYRGATHPFVLPDRVAEACNALARKAGATRFMVLLAAFFAHLSRETGQHDIPVGSPIAGRGRVELEGLIGFFVNTLVLRGDLRGDPTFDELLARVRAVSLDAHSHQDLPFEKLVEELSPERDLAHSPLFQVMFTMDTGAEKEDRVGELTLGSLRTARDTAQFDLTLAFEEVGKRLNGSLNFSTALFDPTTAQRFAAHFCRLVESAVERSERRLSQLSILSPAERHQGVVELNDSARPYPHSSSIQALYQAVAARRPDAIAVVEGGRCLTYGELDRRANRLAHRLRELGVDRDRFVALLFDRSLEMVVATLASLKADGAYAPIEPGTPLRRRAELLADLEAPVLLTEAALLAEAEEIAGYRGKVLDLSPAPGSQGDALPDAGSPEVDSLPDQVAYINFTSGSTGKPKGVTTTHRGVTRLVCDPDFMRFLPDEAVLQLSTYAWDASAWEMWGALLNGGRLVLIQREDVLDFRRLAEVVTSRRIGCLYLTAALFNQVVDQVPESLAGVRVLVSGGDTASPEHFRRALRFLPATRLINEYGPTENSVISTAQPVDERVASEAALPIGIPLSNTTAHVLDSRLRTLPLGAVGELCLGGVGLGRDYLAMPARTASSFVPSPFAPGARLYRTGDRASLHRDGRLRFLGRRDLQVKVRGFRVEPAEVEAALMSLPEVRDAAVTAIAEGPSDKRLVAYLVSEAQPTPTAEAIRKAVAERLPDFMVPSFVVFLEALPLSATGKVDRRALPAPDVSRSAAPYVAPRTPLEGSLAALWCEVLSLDRVGVDQSFFDLGGHSLLATRLVARLRDVLAMEIPLRTLFEAPTVAELAAAVEGAERAAKPLAVPPLSAADRQGDPPLSFAQQRLWFLDQLSPGSALYNVPLALEVEGDLDVAALAAGFDRVVQRHEALRTTFVNAGAGPVQRIADPFAMEIPVVDLGLLAPETAAAAAEQLAAREARRPFDLARDRLLRVVLLRSGKHHVVLVTLHHMVSDGWSLDLLVAEIAAGYEAARGAGEAPPAELPVQYADFAIWQRSWLSGEVLERYLEFWRGELGDDPPVLDLPTDRPRPALQTANGATWYFRLEPRLVAACRELANRSGATLFMLFLAAFQALLARRSGQSDFTIGTPQAGRDEVATEELIGLFVNTLVLRTQLTGRSSFGELLSRVRDRFLAAHPYRALPFEKLVEELKPRRSLSHSPLFQVMLMLQNTRRQGAALSGLELAPVATDSGTAKFDLTLALAEEGERVAASLEYNRDLFDRTSVARLARQLSCLLEAAAGNPRLTLDRLPLLTLAERHQLLVELNDTARPPAEETALQRFASWVARRPDDTALEAAGRSLSYAELDRLADGIALRLRQEGIGRGAKLGLYLERTPLLVAAVLATWKVAAAYVPLDPGYPEPRLRLMVADSGLELILASAPEASDGPAQGPDLGARVVPLSEGPTDEEAGNARPWPRSDDLDTLAYVLYTSGSTGRPKGVEISHRSLANFLAAMEERPGLAPGDRLAAVTSLSFDIAALELLLPLVTGATVVLLDRETVTDGALLAAALDEREITMMQATPATWRLLTAAGWKGRPGMTLLCGGEALPGDLAAALAGKGRTLWNMYGPTETTIWSSIRRIPDGRVTLGRPIANTGAFVLEPAGEPAPLGSAGELLLGGAGVARGYLGRPAHSAERFVPSPFAEPGGRLYRTGDLVRQSRDGELVYLGRLDHQVKVRGVRIELGEIEAALERRPEVSQAVALARQTGQGDVRLVAYLVADRERLGEGERPPSVTDLRQALSEELPEAAVPGHFVYLDELPLTPNGKVDRKALPEPDAERPELRSVYVLPATALERQLAAIWSAALGLERIGAHDNFFDLGGHSLLLVEVQARLTNELESRVPMVELFRYPTVASLAGYLENRQPAEDVVQRGVDRAAARRAARDRRRSRTTVRSGR